MQLINTKPIFKNKPKELLSELKEFHFQSVSFSAFKSMHQRIMANIANSASEYWVVETIVNDSIKVFYSVIISRNNSIEKCR